MMAYVDELKLELRELEEKLSQCDSNGNIIAKEVKNVVMFGGNYREQLKQEIQGLKDVIRILEQKG